jgi:hypothetical protein
MQMQAFGPRRRRSLLSASVLLFLVAVTGYLVGQRQTPATLNSEATREVSSGAVVVEYPLRSGWRRSNTVASTPGLQVAEPLVLAPHGESQRAGLIVGTLVGDGRSLLPQQVLARMGSTPVTEIAHLNNMQAYRYSLPGAAGPGTVATLYAIPDPLPSETVLLCYATTNRPGDLRACENIAALARTTITLEAGENNLTPSTAYGHAVAASMTKIDALRASVRAKLRPQLNSAKLGEPLARAQPPRAAEWIQTQLVLSVRSMRHAYSELASAVEQHSGPGYALAKAQVERAEGEVNRALVNLALLGYG